LSVKVTFSFGQENKMIGLMPGSCKARRVILASVENLARKARIQQSLGLLVSAGLLVSLGSVALLDEMVQTVKTGMGLK
jgi:hypothetical protein